MIFSSGGRKVASILIVDDESPVRSLVRRCLKDLGHEIREAGDAQEALTVMADHPADAVFCDVQMPGEDGIWLTSQIRNRYPATAVILATSVSTISPSVSMRAGVMAYLVKPFSPKGLQSALTVALKWSDDAKAKGVKAEDVGDKLTDWLDSLKDL